jgi:hypothetical protein
MLQQLLLHPLKLHDAVLLKQFLFYRLQQKIIVLAQHMLGFSNRGCCAGRGVKTNV